MTVWDWLAVIAAVLAGDTVLAAVGWHQRCAAAGTRLADRALRVLRRERPAPGQGTLAFEGDPDDHAAETLRCGFHIRRNGLHGDGQVRVRDAETLFYLDAALYDSLDDDAFTAMAMVQRKLATPGVPGVPPPGRFVEPGAGSAEAMWGAFRAVRGGMPVGVQDGMAFAFETGKTDAGG